MFYELKKIKTQRIIISYKFFFFLGFEPRTPICETTSSDVVDDRLLVFVHLFHLLEESRVSTTLMSISSSTVFAKISKIKLNYFKIIFK